MIFRPFHRLEAGCAAYVLGCGGKAIACGVDPPESDVDAYIAFAESKGPEPWFVCTGRPELPIAFERRWNDLRANRGEAP